MIKSPGDVFALDRPDRSFAVNVPFKNKCKQGLNISARELSGRPRTTKFGDDNIMRRLTMR